MGNILPITAFVARKTCFSCKTDILWGFPFLQNMGSRHQVSGLLIFKVKAFGNH